MTSIPAMARPAKFPRLFPIFDSVISCYPAAAQAHKHGDKQAQSDKRNNKQDNLRQTNIYGCDHSNLAFLVSSLILCQVNSTHLLLSYNIRITQLFRFMARIIASLHVCFFSTFVFSGTAVISVVGACNLWGHTLLLHLYPSLYLDVISSARCSTSPTTRSNSSINGLVPPSRRASATAR